MGPDAHAASMRAMPPPSVPPATARQRAKQPPAPEAPATTGGRGSRRGSSLTVIDVARIAGVSAMTVSRALNTPEQVSARTLAKVREAVASTGYVTNRAAGSLSSKRSRLVSAVVPSIAGTVFQDLVQSLIATLGEAGCQLLLAQSGYGVQQDEQFLHALLGPRPDGIVLCGVSLSPEGVRRLQAAGIPVVETWDMVATPIDMVVGFSHERIAQAVAKHFRALGRQAFAFAGGEHDRGQRRAEAFRAALQRRRRRGASVPPVHLEWVPAPGTVAAGRQALAHILQQQPQTDAVFCGSDVVALGVVTEAQARGIRVPEDLAVVGFGDTSLAAGVEPAITSIRVDATAIGRLAAQHILLRSQGKDVPSTTVDVGFELVRRATS